MKDGEKPIANPFVMLREEFDDWAVLFDPDTGHGFGLNPTGVYLWKLLDGEHSVDDMLEALHGDAQDVPQEAGEHLIEFVQELAEQSLAGLEGERVQDCRRRISPCPTCTGTTRFNYELPKLVNLSGERAARGFDCGTGSGNAAQCSIGNDAVAKCQHGYYASTSPCSGGDWPGTACCGGNTFSSSTICSFMGSSTTCCSTGTGGV